MQIKTAFKITPQIRKEIIGIIDERIREAHVTREDFSELKEIVRDLGIKVGELAEAQRELAEAQKRTEARVEELAEAQKRTEIEIQELTRGLKLTRGDLGGLSRSMGYAFENEAYRMLPSFLKDKYSIEMTERMVRKEIGEKEINIFGRAKLKGKNVLVVGEARLRLERKRDERKDVFEELEEKVKAVKKEYKGEIVKILVTHYAEPELIEKAKEKEIIVIQSFEW